MNESKVSRSHAMWTEALAISDQNPVEGGPGKHPFKLDAKSLLRESWKVPEGLSYFRTLPLVFFTPDQLGVVTGGARQLIIGPAGTGKTILLSGKAIDLQRSGDNVLVICSTEYQINYQVAFQNASVDKYHLCDLDTFGKLVGNILQISSERQ